MVLAAASLMILGTATVARAGPGDFYGLFGAGEDDDDGDGDGDDDDDDKDNDFFTLHLALQYGPGPDYPFSLSPDLRYLRRRFEIGLLHSPEAITGFTGLSSGSVCLNNCGAFSSNYHGGALQAGLRVYGETSMLTLQAGVVASELDPLDVGFKLGGEFLLLGPGAVLVTAKPNVIIGGRDRPGSSRLHVPVSIGLLWLLQLESGVTMPLGGASGQWQVPVSLKFAYPIGKVFVDAAVTFPAIAGGSEIETGAEDITLTLGVDLSPWINGWD